MDSKILPEGLILNKTYQVGKCLGKGGFGITYMGFDINLEKSVAIKEFFLGGYVERDQYTYQVTPISQEKAQVFYREKGRFIEEARILAKLDENPGIVKVICYFEEFGTAYIVMEFIEGKSLKVYLAERGGWLPVEETLSIMEPVIKSLAIIHNKGVVHRDISPDNIMITNTGRVKLIDFGAAKSKEMGMSSNKVFKESYSPPEQCQRDGVIGTYSDVYSICVTLYQLITGTKPQRSLERIKNDQLYVPSQFGVDISPVCEATIVSGLSLNIDDRIKNATDLYYFLYVYNKEENNTPEGVKKAIKESSPKMIIERMQKENTRRKYKVYSLIAVCMITLLGCGIILVRQLGRNMQQKDEHTSIAIQESYDELEISEADLKEYKEKLYQKINQERKKDGYADIKVSSTYVEVSELCLEEIVSMSFGTTSQWNEGISKCVTAKMSEYNISDAGWLVLPYRDKLNIEKIYQDAQAKIKAINGDTVGAIDLKNCSHMGISLKIHSDGTVFVIFIYK